MQQSRRSGSRIDCEQIAAHPQLLPVVRGSKEGHLSWERANSSLFLHVDRMDLAWPNSRRLNKNMHAGREIVTNCIPSIQVQTELMHQHASGSRRRWE